MLSGSLNYSVLPESAESNTCKKCYRQLQKNVLRRTFSLYHI